MRLDALGARLVEVAFVVPELCLLLAKGLYHADGVYGLFRVPCTLTVCLQVRLESLLHDLEEAAYHQEKDGEDQQEEDGEPPTPEECKEES